MIFLLLCTYIRYCKPVAENHRIKEYGYTVAISFHSNELVTHRGFYIEFRAFSHADRKWT